MNNLSIIADAHRRIRRLMGVLDQAAEIDGTGAIRAVLIEEIDTLTSRALCTEPEDAADAMLQIDLAVPAMEGAHADAEGATRLGLAAALLALANSAAALAFTSKQGLPDAGSVSGLTDFVCRAPARYALAA